MHYISFRKISILYFKVFRHFYVLDIKTFRKKPKSDYKIFRLEPIFVENLSAEHWNKNKKYVSRENIGKGKSIWFSIVGFMIERTPFCFMAHDRLERRIPYTTALKEIIDILSKSILPRIKLHWIYSRNFLLQKIFIWNYPLLLLPLWLKKETCVFLDEIQEVYRYREGLLKTNSGLYHKTIDPITLIKKLVDKGRFRYALSGSLLGLSLSEIQSNPVGYDGYIYDVSIGFRRVFRLQGDWFWSYFLFEKILWLCFGHRWNDSSENDDFLPAISPCWRNVGSCFSFSRIDGLGEGQNMSETTFGRISEGYSEICPSRTKNPGQRVVLNHSSGAESKGQAFSKIKIRVSEC